MKNRTGLEILLICVLGITGWYLFGLIKQAESSSHELKAIESNNSLVFLNGAGIDVMGNKVESVRINKTEAPPERTDNSMEQLLIDIDNPAAQTDDNIQRANGVFFLLRDDTLDADLRFWNEVKGHLSKFDTVRLAAYCENNRCVEAIRKNPDETQFTIMEYGEVIDMQAIINADATGEFWLRTVNGSKKINWRDGVQTPYDIAVNIGLEQ